MILSQVRAATGLEEEAKAQSVLKIVLAALVRRLVPSHGENRIAQLLAAIGALVVRIVSRWQLEDAGGQLPMSLCTDSVRDPSATGKCFVMPARLTCVDIRSRRCACSARQAMHAAHAP